MQRIVHVQWKSWKFQLKILEMRKRSRNNWSQRCVRKCCEVWKLKVKKMKLGIKLHQSRSTFEIFVVRRKRILPFLSLFVFRRILRTSSCVSCRLFHVMAVWTKESPRWECKGSKLGQNFTKEQTWPHSTSMAGSESRRMHYWTSRQKTYAQRYSKVWHIYLLVFLCI